MLGFTKNTSFKVAVARILYRLVAFFLGNQPRRIQRRGINYEVDISEGIDFYLFLFGTFQDHVTHNPRLALEHDAVAIDVGANVGIMSLTFAKALDNGTVYAFEPTHYAFKRLQRNLELNPSLRDRIVVENKFVSSESHDNPELEAHSSWPLTGSEDRHEVHQGVVKSTLGVGSTTLDAYCRDENISRIDLIKIDTDGHELEVLRGAHEALSKFKPKVIFEIGQYIMSERGVSFSDYFSFFDALNFDLFSPSNVLVDQNNYSRLVPAKGTTDLIAIARN